MPRIMPDPRYFSMPSIDVGAEVFRNRALNCWPWVRSLTHSPDAVTHSPAEIVAAWPTTVTRSRCPRAFARRTQKPLSELWKVTRSTRPASTSWVNDSACGFMRIARSSVSSRRHYGRAGWMRQRHRAAAQRWLCLQAHALAPPCCQDYSHRDESGHPDVLSKGRTHGFRQGSEEIR